MIEGKHPVELIVLAQLNALLFFSLLFTSLISSFPALFTCHIHTIFLKTILCPAAG